MLQEKQAVVGYKRTVNLGDYHSATSWVEFPHDFPPEEVEALLALAREIVHGNLEDVVREHAQELDNLKEFARTQRMFLDKEVH